MPNLRMAAMSRTVNSGLRKHRQHVPRSSDVNMQGGLMYWRSPDVAINRLAHASKAVQRLPPTVSVFAKQWTSVPVMFACWEFWRIF